MLCVDLPDECIIADRLSCCCSCCTLTCIGSCSNRVTNSDATVNKCNLICDINALLVCNELLGPLYRIDSVRCACRNVKLDCEENIVVLSCLAAYIFKETVSLVIRIGYELHTIRCTCYTVKLCRICAYDRELSTCNCKLGISLNLCNELNRLTGFCLNLTWDNPGCFALDLSWLTNCDRTVNKDDVLCNVVRLAV